MQINNAVQKIIYSGVSLSLLVSGLTAFAETRDNKPITIPPAKNLEIYKEKDKNKIQIKSSQDQCKRDRNSARLRYLAALERARLNYKTDSKKAKDSNDKEAAKIARTTYQKAYKDAQKAYNAAKNAISIRCKKFGNPDISPSVSPSGSVIPSVSPSINPSPSPTVSGSPAPDSTSSPQASPSTTISPTPS